MIGRPLRDDGGPPWLVEPDAFGSASPAADLAARLRASPGEVDDALRRHGAVLFRGFPFADAAGFQAIADAIGPPHDYVGGNSPRTRVVERVWNSTEYPRHLELAIHNEMAYLDRYPARIAFGCLKPSPEGGETPIADGRRVADLLPSALAERLSEKRVTYVRNLHGGGGTGLSWQASFHTDDRATVEARCREVGVAWRWSDRGDLRTTITRDAFAEHPATRERVWFNQVVLWHHASLGKTLRDVYAARAMDPDDFPHDCRYGDGSPIPDDDVAVLRDRLARATIAFPWRQGDVMLLDNVLVGHGRRPFRGDRRILVSLFA